MKQFALGITKEEIINMSEEERLDFLGDRLVMLFKLYPSMEQWERTATLDVVKQLEYIANPEDKEEKRAWDTVIQLFDGMAAKFLAA
jgi:hypothetical protein